MKINQILISLIFLSTGIAYCQDFDSYIAQENTRISEANKIEKKIEIFIAERIATYNLPKSTIDLVTQNLLHEHHGSHAAITGDDVKRVLQSRKRDDLRKIYFTENREEASFFEAKEMNEALAINCVNGGFESGIQGYTFQRHSVTPPDRLEFGCPAIGYSYGVFTPQMNQFQADATLVTTQNEPKLQSLGISIPVTASGTRAIKLNPSTVNINSDGQTGNLTAMLRDLQINSTSIDFNYLQVGHIPTSQDIHVAPNFQYQLFDSNTGELLISKCIYLTTSDCRYTRIPDTANPGQIISYSGWICERIDTEMYMGRNVTLKFLVSDCEYRGHYNTVYIDNICGSTCNPTYGSIKLNPVNFVCPTENFNVCGTIQLPINYTVNSITLSILNSNNVVVAQVNSGSNNGNSFCFSVDPLFFSGLPGDEYEFKVDAVFNTVCGGTNIPSTASDFSSVDGVDLDMKSCCPSNLNITNTNPVNIDNKQAQVSISASNVLNNSQNSIYHAGNFVVLTPGFHSTNGSKLRAYIEGCTNEFVGRPSQKKKVGMLEQNATPNATIETSLIKIYPNPTIDKLTIDSTIRIEYLEIRSLEGRLIYKEDISTEDLKFNISLSSLNNGMYILIMTDTRGETFSRKIIKK